MRKLTMTTVIAAAMVAATAARADTLGLGPNRGVHDAWSGSPQTVAYPVRLPRGGVAVRFAASWCGTVDLADRHGRVVGRLAVAPYDEDVDGGEMLVPAAGRYRIRATGVRCADGLPARGSFDLALVRDCVGDARTTCRLAPGETRRGTEGYTGDRDWYRLELRAGRRYDVAARGAGAGLELLDAAGNEVAAGLQQPDYCVGDQCRSVVAGFAPPASGVYFAAVGAEGGRYAVGLVGR